MAGPSQSSNYLWPVWRCGRVLVPQGNEPLRIDKAQEIGSLFQPGRAAALRYLGQRRAELSRLAQELGATYRLDWPSHLDHGTPPFFQLGQTWQPEEFLISYSFVPVVRLPRFVLEIGDFAWQIRESLTVCGAPAKSKAWITASLIECRRRPTDLVGLTSADIGAAREAFAPFAAAAMESLIAYYLRVLNEDSKTLQFETPFVIDNLELLAETEIVVAASLGELGEAFDVLEREGFAEFRRLAHADEFPGAPEVLDFLAWSELTPARRSEGWSEGRPKILAMYADEPACGVVRALLVPQIRREGNCTWYAALTERREPEKPVSRFPLSEAASRFLAQEYGRYF